jgi:hypothetical protein
MDDRILVSLEADFKFVIKGKVCTFFLNVIHRQNQNDTLTEEVEVLGDFEKGSELVFQNG